MATHYVLWLILLHVGMQKIDTYTTKAACEASGAAILHALEPQGWTGVYLCVSHDEPR